MLIAGGRETMKLLTWNIQWGYGCDGRVDLPRIVDTAMSKSDADVLCFQEVARNYPGMPGSRGEDQFAELAALLPGYAAVAGVAADHPADDGGRRRFGNMILSRLPVRQVYRHLLPSPADPAESGMPRIAFEAVVAAPSGDVRVITTHLEWYSRLQRSAQVEALRAIYAEGHGHARWGGVVNDSGGPFHTLARPAATIVCGDFNLEYDDPLHARMLAPFADGTPPLADAWDLVRPGEPYPGTFKVHEKWVPGDPELHCDFFFVSTELVPRVRAVFSDRETQASDHQPVVLELA
jgi:endonuclease/exonuclease/phosphatase family metal-dependent hydrolase